VVIIEQAEAGDAQAILELQKLAYQSEAVLYNDWSIPPLTQTLESLLEEFSTSVVLKAMTGSQIVGSVRAKVDGDVCAIGRLIVNPRFQCQGIGSRLLKAVEDRCAGVARFELFTGSKSQRNIRLYQRAGYRITETRPMSPTISLTFLEKSAHAVSKQG
jgi:ribosomal protein S18 acetylase RimI-like enzyme